MTADIVNLNKVRKARERAGKTKQAEENRARFGQSKADRSVAEMAKKNLDAVVEGAELQPPPRLDDNHDDLDPGNVS